MSDGEGPERPEDPKLADWRHGAEGFLDEAAGNLEVAELAARQEGVTPGPDAMLRALLGIGNALVAVALELRAARREVL